MLKSLIESTVQKYVEMYGKRPDWLVAAPGRVNLIGEHTDYNDGFVFPMAIERYTVIAAGRKETSTNCCCCSSDSAPKAEVFSMNLGELAEIAVLPPFSPGDKVVWSSYVQGTLACFAEKLPSNIRIPAFQAVLQSNVPIGSGLSSSASLEVSVATLLETMTGFSVSGVEKALLCQKAEHEYAKMPCGIMDQFIAALGEQGNALLIDCRSKTPTAVPISDPGVVVLITNSNVKHELTGSEYPERRSSCFEAAKILGVSILRDATPDMVENAKAQLTSAENGDRLYRRAKHVVTENLRTLAMAEALKKSDWENAGKQMYASHVSMRDDFEISCPELDILVEIAQKIGTDGGVIGSRMTGGGFGGCTVSLVKADKLDSVISTLQNEYRAKTGIEPVIFASRPAQGASVFSLD